MSTKRYFVLMYVLLGGIILTGCGERRHLHELQHYVTQLRQATTLPKILPPRLTGLAPPASVVYRGSNLRSPFVPALAVNAGANDGNQPLQNYPLTQLRYKGIVTQGANSWGFILAPDNKLYQVRLGDIIGDRYGKIITISSTSLVIQERVEQIMSLGKPDTRIVTLQLKGPS